MAIYELLQNGMVVAAVDSPEDGRARAEIAHYAMLYLEDGPVEIRKAPPQEGE